MQTFIILISVILSWIQSYEANHIYSLPFTPRKDPWLVPSTGVLISEHAPLYIARKVKGDVTFAKYENIVKPAVDYAMQFPEYQRANVGSSISKSRINRLKNANSYAPPVLYPEFMIVVSYDLYETLNKDTWKIIPYIIAFYNGVDTVFRELKNPEIRLNIAAIVIEEEYDTLGYLSRSPSEPSKIKGSTFIDGAKFWYKQKDQIPLDSYDGFISMTSLKICQEETEDTNKCTRKIRGIATISGVCHYSHTDMVTDKKVIVQDNGKFSGIAVAAHEIGHLLGANHDGFLRTAEDGRYDNIKRCNMSSTYNVTNGYIMYASSTLSSGQRYWSDCSLDYFQQFFKYDNHSCLHNVPVSGQYPIPRFLPGQIIGNFDNYCRSLGHGKSCADPKNPCDRPNCEVSETNTGCLYMTDSIPDGLRCDDNDPTKVCMVGKCVSVNSFK